MGRAGEAQTAVTRGVSAGNTAYSAGAKVCWEVKGVRNDLRVRRHGAPVEMEKPPLEKGTYQHPELYGQPPEKGMNYEATRPRPQPALPVALGKVGAK